MDGTLLGNDGKLSKTSYKILQPLIDDGLAFVPATGRTRDNAIGGISPLKLTMPIICDNGTFVYDTVKSKFNRKKLLDIDTAIFAIEKIISEDVSPLINTLDENTITVYHSELKTKEQQKYFDSRTAYGLSEYIEDHTYTKYKDKNVFNLSMLDKHEKLIDLFNLFKDDENMTAEMFPSHYFDEYYWLEILPVDSGKGQSVDYLKDTFKPNKVICFGDNLNDLCMFERADIKIATENAVEEIRDIADIVIGHCKDDSVAKYIQNDFCS